MTSIFNLKYSIVWALASLSLLTLNVPHVVAQVQPTERIRLVDVADNTGELFIFNDDNTLSIYSSQESLYALTRANILDDIDEPITIDVSTFGKRLALVYDSLSGQKMLAIFERTSLGVTLVYKQGIGPSVVGGYSDLLFSVDGAYLFVIQGENTVYQFTMSSGNADRHTVGSMPSVLFRIEQNRIGVINKDSETLSIINAEDKKIEHSVGLGTNPVDGVYNPVNNRIYVSHVGSDNIYVIDPVTGEVILDISVGNDPTDLEVTEKGDVFVVNNSSGSLTKIGLDFEVEEYDLDSSAYFKSSPFKLAYFDNTNKLYLLNTTESKFIVFDTITNSIVHNVDTESFPVNWIADKVGQRLYYWYFNANSLIQVNLSSFNERYLSAELFGGETYYLSKPQSVTVDEVDNLIYVSNLGADYITVIDGSTQKPTQKITVGRTIQNLFINESLRVLYAVSPSDNTLTAIELASGTYKKTVVKLGKQSRGGSIDELTGRLYYSNAADASISVIDGHTNKIVAEINLPEKSFPIVSDVDETRSKLYVALYGGDGIAVIDTKTLQLDKVISTGPNPLWVRYIPEYDLILSTVEGAQQILVIDPDTAEVIQRVEISGEPYRIFFDEEKEYTYINRRSENTVTTMALDLRGKLKVIEESNKLFWGQTDARPYNMVAYNKNTGLAYFTAGNSDSVSVVKVEHDDQDIVEGKLYAKIDSTGNVFFVPEEPTFKGYIRSDQFQIYTIISIVGALIVALIYVLVRVLLSRRRNPY